MNKFDIVTKVQHHVSVSSFDTFDTFSVYIGECELEAEKHEAVLELCVELVDALTPTDKADVECIRNAWEVLEVNGHIDI